jgi:hypothetical protein
MVASAALAAVTQFDESLQPYQRHLRTVSFLNIEKSATECFQAIFADSPYDVGRNDVGAAAAATRYPNKSQAAGTRYADTGIASTRPGRQPAGANGQRSAANNQRQPSSNQPSVIQVSMCMRDRHNSLVSEPIKNEHCSATSQQQQCLGYVFCIRNQGRLNLRGSSIKYDQVLFVITSMRMFLTFS